MLISLLGVGEDVTWVTAQPLHTASFTGKMMHLDLHVYSGRGCDAVKRWLNKLRTALQHRGFGETENEAWLSELVYLLLQMLPCSIFSNFISFAFCNRTLFHFLILRRTIIWWEYIIWRTTGQSIWLPRFVCDILCFYYCFLTFLGAHSYLIGRHIMV